MRYFLIVAILLQGFCLSAQTDSALFDRSFKLKKGIYTSYFEILENSPKYPDYLIETNNDIVFGKLSMNFYDQNMIQQDIKDEVFAYVQEGYIVVKYDNQFYKLILTGPISTFYKEKITSNSPYNSPITYTTVDDKLFLFDLRTGYINKLNLKNIDWILKRDSVLYTSYLALSDSKKRKTLYSFILKYNQRNPIYIRTE
jgi:hypothetical protein